MLLLLLPLERDLQHLTSCLHPSPPGASSNALPPEKRRSEPERRHQSGNHPSQAEKRRVWKQRRRPYRSLTLTLNINLNLTLISHFDSVRVSYGHIRIRSPSVLTVSWVVCTAFLPPHCYSSVKETPQAGHSATISSYDLIVSVSFRDFKTDPTLP